MAGVIGLRGPDIEKRDALRGYKVVFQDADRPIIRPHTGCPVLRIKDDAPVVERHVFGFTRKFASFNARADRLESSAMWAKMFGKGHGVAPVSYILEWADLGDGKRGYRIERKDGAAMVIPALVGGYWEDREHRAFALITTEPNDFVGRIHNRVICQLDDDQVDVWLHPEAHSKDDLIACLGPGGNDDFVAYPLAEDVGRARFDDPSKLEAVGEPIAWADVKHLPMAADVMAAEDQKKGKRRVAKKATSTAGSKQTTL